jgi:hypothetical protein
MAIATCCCKRVASGEKDVKGAMAVNGGVYQHHREYDFDPGDVDCDMVSYVAQRGLQQLLAPSSTLLLLGKWANP